MPSISIVLTTWMLAMSGTNPIQAYRPFFPNSRQTRRNRAKLTATNSRPHRKLNMADTLLRFVHAGFRGPRAPVKSARADYITGAGQMALEIRKPAGKAKKPHRTNPVRRRFAMFGGTSLSALEAVPRRAEQRQRPAVKAPPARHLPGQHEPGGQDEQKRIGRKGAGKQEADVHEAAEERRDAGQKAENEAEPDGHFAEGDQVGKHFRVRQRDVFQKRGVPAIHLAFLRLRQRALDEAGNRGAGVFAAPFFVGQLAPARFQPRPAQIQPDQEPQPGRTGAGEQEMGNRVFGNDDGVAFTERLCHAMSPSHRENGSSRSGRMPISARDSPPY